MTVKVRFAPSPTGLLHVGNARIALANWLYAKKHGGVFLLRIDDTDRERSKIEYEDGIKRDLTWLGITWDEFDRQSERQLSYDAAIEGLKKSGRLYACYETPEELEFKRKKLAARGKPPIYDQEGFSLNEEQKKAYEAEGRTPHWRFKLVPEDIHWTDLVRGPVHFKGADLSDPVLIREDGLPLYTITSVVDDIELGVRHIVRGEDHVSNTAVQLQLIDALGANSSEFTFAHISLMTGKLGEGLSKRFASLSLHAQAESGIEPMAVNSLLASLGTSDPVEPHQSLQELVTQFSFSKYSRSTPKFDEEELQKLSAKIVHTKSFSSVKNQLQDLGLSHVDEAFWHVVRPNLSSVKEIKEWWDICRGNVQPVIQDPNFIRDVVDVMPAGVWGADTMKEWVGAIKEKTGRKGKELFMPLRLALTGQEYGPEMGALLPLIGPDKTRERLTSEL